MSDHARSRPKPIYRTRNLVLAAIALFVGWLVFEVVFALTATPGDGAVARGQFLELLGDAAPADQNDDDPYAGDLILQIAVLHGRAAFALEQNRESVYASNLFVMAEPGTEAFELGRRFLDRWIQLGYDLRLEQLAATRNLRFRAALIQDQPLLVSVILDPTHGISRRIARFESRRAEIAAASGDWDTFATHLNNSTVLVDFSSRQGSLIARFNAIGIEILTLETIRTVALDRDMPAEVLSTLADVLVRVESMPDIALAMRGEKIMILESIDRAHTGAPGESGRYLPAAYRGGAPSLENLAGLVYPGRRHTEDDVERYFDNMDSLLALEPSKALAVLEGTSQDETIGVQHPDLIAQQLRAPVLENAFGYLVESILSELKHLRVRAGVRALLAVESFIAENGRPPDSLDELIASAGRDALIDPLTGEPFAYAAGAAVADDPHGRPFVLYVGSEVTLEDLFDFYAAPADDTTANLGRRSTADVDFTTPESSLR
ncbi:MAG: hypothetical protein AAFQ71_14495 [Planctomycetota bacterium]